MSDDTPLLRLARAVADGSRIDWDAEFAARPDLAPRLEQMRLLHAVAEQRRLAPANLPGGRFPAADDSTLTHRPPGFASGQILGGRYRIGAFLGAGGMGEVWQAFDLKLQVEVALKRVLWERPGGNDSRDRLRREVRTARTVVSPNVCRIFDLVEVDGQELVSMELVDGATLGAIIEERGPLATQEAMGIAQQFLAGLEAIHAAGLLHRDLKPGNIMVTRTGRVVLMDFGLAQPLAEGAAPSIAGTPAYMAPEQIRGGPLDPRTDIYAAGVVLAEMIGTGGACSRSSREALLTGVRLDPPRLPAGPWQPVLTRAVAPDRGARPASARELIRALEQVTMRARGGDDVNPYPGLASFTEKDTEYFFGREVEVEEMWRRLIRPAPHALIGPSGAGKSSFLRAGLLPARPDGWRSVVCTPGSAPFVALAQALAPELAGDAEAVRQIVRFQDPDVAVGLIAGWRRRHAEVLIVVDQFEELFTQCRPEVQRGFADLIGRLAVEADARVLLSMRDDFLFHCSGQPALAPIFAELTPLRPPAGAALRRAIVQPALMCGCRFEDDAMPDEMIEEVAEERGALPLLAFALAQLWDKRDRERGLLTRAAYRGIGGVAGALARHAEATLERIGPGRQALVREIFRNLVTAQGTRAARDREDLLSVFPDRGPAVEVLDALVDSRLLTSFEVASDEAAGAPGHQQVEIIHESLLAAWPRLVRWRTQDADGAQLRDQLRQTARLWDERGRPADLLWTGTSYREFLTWRERYPGGLTAVEEAYARATIANAERRARLKRLSVTAAFVALLAVVGIVGWYGHRENQARLRADASRLLAFGQLQIEANPTLALAFAIASLERADHPEVRRFAIEAINRGPLYFELGGGSSGGGIAFSPDGRWLAAGRLHDGTIHLHSARGGPPTVLKGPGQHVWGVRFGQGSDTLMTFASGTNLVQVWSVPEGRPLRSLPYGSENALHFPLFMSADARTLLTTSIDGPVTARTGRARLLRWPPEGDAPEVFGELENSDEPVVDAGGTEIAYLREGGIHLRPVEGFSRSAARLVGRHHDARRLAECSDAGLLASFDGKGKIRVWAAQDAGSDPVFVFDSPEEILGIQCNRSGTLLGSGHGGRTARVWDLQAPTGTPPLELRGSGTLGRREFHPGGRWAATSSEDMGVGLWPLPRHLPRILVRGEPGGVEFRGVAFAPDSSWVAAVSGTDRLTRWPLTRAGGKPQVIHVPSGVFAMAAHPDGHRLLVGGSKGVALVSFDGRPPERLAGFAGWVWAVAFSRDGRFAAAGGGAHDMGREDRLIRVWNLEDGSSRDLRTTEGVYALQFLPDDRILFVAGPTSGKRSLYQWRIGDARAERLREDFGDGTTLDVSPDGSAAFMEEYVASRDSVDLRILDLEDGSLDDFHRDVWDCRHNKAGTMAVCGVAYTDVRIIPLDGRPAHDLIGHTGIVNEVAISPDDQWVVSISRDGTVRLWPMPEGDPILRLPRKRFLDRLRALTNVRVILDAAAPGGWKQVLDPPHPGWETPVAPTPAQ
jgi:WD40 repeat protein